MGRRISPLWYPVLALAAPIWGPLLGVRYREYREQTARAAAENESRIASAGAVEIPALEHAELRVLSEWRARNGFAGEAGVSYLFRTDRGTLLYDVAFGDQTGVVSRNAARLGLTGGEIDAVAVSHLHNDHMGGMQAFRSREVRFPATLRPPKAVPCYLPSPAGAPGLDPAVVRGPQLLSAGIASTGPLARRLFFLGWVEEQALVLRLQKKGLAVFSGCGHPTLPAILRMVRRMSPEPIYAIGGGLHLPFAGGREARGGVDLQTIIGTGLPPWRRIAEADVDGVIRAIGDASPQRVFLSAHDTGDEALRRIKRSLPCQVEVLEAGAVYEL